MSIITHPTPPPNKRTFLDLPPETRIMIYKLTCSTFTVHVRPRFLTPHRQLIEQPTLVTLTNCNILSLSRQIRAEALPYVRISPAVQICRSAVVEIHQAHVARRRPLHNDEYGGHGEEDTCLFLAQLRPTPCDLHQTAMFTLLTSDRAAVAKYFLLGFHGIQKEDCEILTTNWMKLVEWDHHPRRCDHHVSSDGTSSVRTVLLPPWWPEDVPGSLDLLSSDVTALEHSTYRHAKELQNPNALEILEEMFKVLQLMERFEAGTGEGDGDGDGCAETILAGLGF